MEAYSSAIMEYVLMAYGRIATSVRQVKAVSLLFCLWEFHGC